jgi:hypothetical protein
MMRRLEFSLLWEQAWKRVAQSEGWNSETDIYEYAFVDIEPLEYDGDYIDGVMFFFDGTVEFHLQKEQDALCWDLFPIEVIEDVYARINLK